MLSTKVSTRVFCGLNLVLVAPPAAQATAVTPAIDRARLAAIDRAFVCPEDLPSNVERIKEIGRFDAAMAKAVKNVSMDQIMSGRLFLLRKHHCLQTLENLRQSGIQ